MARTRALLTSVEQWSCPLCTLLNNAEDRRCMACDNARPPAEQLRKSQPLTPPAGAATASNVYRPASGVFFSSLPRNHVDSGAAAAAWRQEPRLVVNRRRGNKWRKATEGRETNVESEQDETGGVVQTAGFTGTEMNGKQAAEVENELQRKDVAMEAVEVVEQTQEMQDEEDTALDVEEPCFNLLGSGAAVFAAPEQESLLEDPCPTDETKSRDGSEEVDFGLEQEVEAVEPPPRYPGFMPASKVVIDEPAIEEKLASAGLDLSDSDDDEEPKKLRRPKDDSWEDKWVCRICTSLNDQIAMECTSCMCKRFPDDSSPKETPASSNLQWACHICSTLNSPELMDCQMCYSTRKPGAQASSSSSGDRWSCPVCTTSNARDTTRCEACARTRDKQPEKVYRMRLECPVCTNVNALGSTRCELCDSALQPEKGESNDFVDLSSSPLERKASYTDLENPYADLSQYDDYAAPNDDAAPDDDYVEEISDHERPPMLSSNTRPVVRRADLREFEHFVSMEDLRRDYSCCIDYSKMFAGQRSRKSYADRLATRKAESRKRLRGAAQKAGGASASTSRGGKAARGSKKRKAPAASRRASGSSAKAPKAKRAKKNGATARRASSATSYSSGINHYDDSAGADLGGDVTTMAWEGVGSAGYL